MFYNLCIFTGQYHSQSMICNGFQDERSGIGSISIDFKAEISHIHLDELESKVFSGEIFNKAAKRRRRLTLFGSSSSNFIQTGWCFYIKKHSKERR